jgi:hypothetical protein
MTAPARYRGGLRMAQPSAHASLDDRARLKERDKNVRFKQSMTHHVSHEGLVPWKLEANGDASRLVPGWLCLWVWELWRSSYRDPQTARTQGRPVAREAADARAIPAHHPGSRWPTTAAKAIATKKRGGAQYVSHRTDHLLKPKYRDPIHRGISRWQSIAPTLLAETGISLIFEPSFANVTRMLRHGQSSLSMSTTLSFGAPNGSSPSWNME